MNIPKEIIEKAADGGWKISIRHRERGTGYEVDEKVVLDPNFWQALVIREKWDTSEDRFGDWLYYAHRFYDLILTQKPNDAAFPSEIGAFWQEVLSTPKQ